MDFDQLVFTGHAAKRIFERGILTAEIRQVLTSGEVIADYPNDTPYPSCLMLGWIGSRPLHVVAALDGATRTCYVVTAYVPDPAQWTPDFRLRRIP